MDGDRIVNIMLIVGMLALVTSSLAIRRLPTRSVVMMALGWIAIFAVGAIALRFLL